jgi:hypothetical protein
MVEATALNFEELVGELHEFVGRCVGVDIRDDATGLLIAAMEGEFNQLLEDEPGEWAFQVGRVPPQERIDDGERIRFISTSWGAIHVHANRFANAERADSGIGAFTVTIRTTDGLRITVWPAMPPKHQYTSLHDEVR